MLNLFATDDSFFMIAHSFGSLLALKLAETLEFNNKFGKIVMVDGSPLFLKLLNESLSPVDTPDEAILQEILETLIRMDFPSSHTEVMKKALTGANWDDRLESFLKFNSETSVERKYSRETIVGLFNRLKMGRVLDEASFSALSRTKISLVLPSEKLITDITADYGLSWISSETVESVTMKGNHVSILKSMEVIKFVRSLY